MPRQVLEALENNGKKVISDWDIPSDIRGRLEGKLDLLRAAEVDGAGKIRLPLGMHAGPNVYGQKWIYKLKVNGSQALRPMFCLGPKDKGKEWTVLTRAKERDDNTTEQKIAASEATVRRQAILDNRRVTVVFSPTQKEK